MARHAGAAVLMLLLRLLSGCAYFHGGNGEDEIETEPQTGIRYGVEIRGEGVDDQIRSRLLSASNAHQTISRPPASAFVLRRRAEADLPNIEGGLRSLGYYEGTARYDVSTVREDNQIARTTVGGLADSVEDYFKGAPTILTYHVVLGPPYTLGSLKMAVSDPRNRFLAPTPEALKLEPGQRAEAQPVLDAQSELVSQAQRLGYAFAKADKLKAVIDPDRKLMDVTLSVTTGPIVHMGEFMIVGADNVDQRFLRQRVLFRRGDRYHPDVMDKTRQSLIDTNLFSTVVVDQPDQLDATGRLPITYTVTERKPRSIGAGAGYATDEGPNVSVFWENRNFLGAGEKFESDLYASPLRQELSASFVKPDVGARKHNLLAGTSLKAEDTDAYESKSVGAAVAIERPLWSDRVTGSLGGAYRLAKIKPKDEEEDSFGLLSLPGAIKMDYSDNLLDPTKGWRLNFLATPYTDTLNAGVSFLKTQAVATTYMRLTDGAKYILALRGSLGSIAGANRDEIPADERFYAGGGGSIRGYGYQLAGPLNDNDDPVGGRSLIELSGELRYRMTDTIGLVYFIDGGTVADSPLPSLEEDLFIGTGVGLRYITPIAGEADLDLTTQLTNGRVNGRIGDLGAVAPFIGQELQGAIDFAFVLDAAEGKQNARGEVRASRIGGSFGTLAAASVTGRATDVRGRPGLDVKFAADDFVQPGLAIKDAAVTAAGSLAALRLTAKIDGSQAAKPFDLATRLQADVAGETKELALQSLAGSFAKQPIKLRRTATVLMAGASYSLQDLDLSFGRARLRAHATLADWPNRPRAGCPDPRARRTAAPGPPHHRRAVRRDDRPPACGRQHRDRQRADRGLDLGCAVARSDAAHRR